MKVVVSAKKNFKFSKAEKMNEIKNSANKQPESHDGTFYMLSNEAIDNYQEKYLSDDDEDEFFRGYSQAKEYNCIRDTIQTYQDDSQEMRNKLILEDFTPGYHKPARNFNNMNIMKVEDPAMQTPFKGDIDTVNVTQTQEYSRANKLGSGSKIDFENIKMLDLDMVDASKIEKPVELQQDRGSTIKQLLHLYEEEITSKIAAKQLDSSRDTSKENILLNSDKKRLTDLYQNCKKDLEIARNKISDLTTSNKRLDFELQSVKNELLTENK